MTRRRSPSFRPLAIAFLLAPLAAAGLSAQVEPGVLPSGPVIAAAGPTFGVPDPDFRMPDGHEYRVVFEIVSGADAGEMDPDFTTVARFLNLHARHGVELENLHVATVVHGGGWTALLDQEAYAARFDGADNPSRDLVLQLIEAGVDVVLCGQTAGARGVDRGELLPGVQLAWSAMTAIHWFQSEGYTFNPW